MTCWNGFAQIIDTMVPNYSPQDLEMATLRAALEFGTYIGGYSDSYDGTADLSARQEGCGCGSYPTHEVSVALPIGVGWELAGVVRVSINGTDVPPEGQRFAYTCMRWKQSDCGRIAVSPITLCGYNPKVHVDFTVLPVPGQVSDIMPDFLLSKYATPMQYLIASFLLTATDPRKAGVYYDQYLMQAKRTKNRLGSARGLVGGRMV